MATYTRTTRLTSPEPTGVKKLLQDMWDAQREEQVKTFMTYDTQMCMANYTLTLRRAIDRAVEEGKKPNPERKPIFVLVCGSYERTDKSTANDKRAGAFMRRLGYDETCLLTQYAKRNDVEMAATGIRTTGCLIFADGRRQPVGHGGFQLTGEAPDDIKMIETFYCMLVVKA
jgi:hypothetical protein